MDKFSQNKFMRKQLFVVCDLLVLVFQVFVGISNGNCIADCELETVSIWLTLCNSLTTR